MVEVKRLWWRRYRGLFALCLLASLLSCVFMLWFTVHNYHDALSGKGYATRWAYRDQKYWNKKNHSDERLGTYAQFRFDAVRIYDTNAQANETMGYPQARGSQSVLPATSTGLLVHVGLIMAGMAIGAFAAAWDHRGAFDRFIVGLGAKRLHYYWWRTGGLVALATAATTITVGGYLAGLHAFIPAADINLAPGVAGGILLYNWILTVMAVLCGQLIATVFAHPVAVGGIAVAASAAGYYGVGNLATAWANLTRGVGFSLDAPLGGSG